VLDLALIHKGRLAAEELCSKVLALPTWIEKAKKAPPNPLSAKGFDALVLDVMGELQDKGGTVEQKGIAKFLEKLNVKWDGLTPEQRSKVVAGAAKKYLAVTEDLVGIVPGALFKKGPGIVAATKEAAGKKFKLPIEPSFNVVDEWAVAHVAASAALYVTDANKTRVDAYSGLARGIISKGLKDGLDRKQIADMLEKEVGLASAGRTNAYWQMLASTYVSRARSFSVLSGFDEAGIDAFQFEAVLDEVTTEVCRFMHGQIFRTQSALKTYDNVSKASDPESVKELQPWVSTGKNAQGEQALFYESGGKKRLVAKVDQPGLGIADKRGTYTKAMSPKQLQARGMSTPPLHGHCRSTIVPVFGEGSPHAAPKPPPDAPGAASPAAPPKGRYGLPEVIQSKLPPEVAQHVRPMPVPTDFSGCDMTLTMKAALAELGIEKAGDDCELLAAEYIKKINAMPKAHGWTDEFVHVTAAEGADSGADGKIIKPPGAKSNWIQKVKPQEQEVEISKVVSQSKVAAADKKKLLEYAMNGPPVDKDEIVLGKWKGKFYHLQGDETAWAGAVALKGWSSAPVKVIDIDAELEKKKDNMPKWLGGPGNAPKPPKPKPLIDEQVAAEFAAGAPPPTAPIVVPKPKPVVAPEPVVPAALLVGNTADNILHEQTGAQRGSNDGGFYTGKDGVKRYVKFYKDESQAHAEHLANQIYNDLGHGAPESQLFVNAYKTRATEALKSAPASAHKGIIAFTGSSYGGIRDSETEGKPNNHSDNITRAYDTVEGTRGPNGESMTFYRGIGVSGSVVSKVMDLHMGQEVWGLGIGGKGATSSSTWDPNVSFVSSRMSDPGAGSLNVIYKIKSKNGIAVETISQHTHEREVLLSRDARFRTTGLSWREGTNKRVLIIEAEELDDSDDAYFDK
jgi:hypothetical protein